MLEGYITPLLMSYIDKYVKNIKPSDLKLSFWGGDVVLRNLELRLDVLEKELKYPVKIKSGCIRELTVHIPWNAIASQSVEVTIKDIEFVVKLKDVRLHSAQTEPSQQSEDESDVAIATQPAEQPAPADQAPGYLKGYLTRISDNIILHVQNMVVKVIDEECDMMFTVNIGTVEGYTTDENWEKKFIYTDYFQGDNSLYKVCEVADLAVNLHPIEGTYEGESTKEPFIQRCSFTCRTKYDYRGSVVVKETMNVFFETVEFCVDERQFCLYFHHLEWLLAMYYTSKRLKGRDDQQRPSDSQSAATPGMPAPGPLGTDAVPPTSTSPPNDGDQSGSPAGATNPKDQQQGWGSWMWSFLEDPEVKENRQEASSEHTSSATSRRTPQFSFAIFSKSVSVTLKVTHQMQVPMFYSVRSFTKPVLHINFTGCKAQLDQDPSTKLFLVSVGIMSIDASITGICPCAKKFPASWRASATSATEQVLVFLMGEEETCDPQAILQGSLFAAPVAYSLSSDVDPSRPPSPSEAFKAVWFSYEYYDVSPSCQIEECTETLNIGRVKAAISPDVIHRLQHFYETFLQSQEANPKFSEGMVVIGDPTAETIFRIKLAGGETILTPNVHYLPTVKPGHRPTKPQKPSFSKTKLPKLPGLCASLSESSIHIVQPMYSGNASEEVPQRYQLHAKFCEIQVSSVSFRTLEGSLKQTSMEVFLQIPSLEASKHSKTHGQGESDNAYLQLDIQEMSSTLSIADVSKLLFISGSWKTDPATSSTQMKFNSPPTLPPNVGKLQISLKNAIVTKSTSEHFSLLSVILGECSGAIVEYSNTDKKLCQVSPFFKGPYDTQRWNKVSLYKQSDLKKQDSFYPEERLIEFFMATPHKNCEEDYFPAVQTTVSGFVVCLSPLLLSYVRHLPLDVFSTPQQQTSYEPVKSEIVTRELPPGGVTTVTPSTSHSPTASIGVTPQQCPQGKEDGFIHLVKLYAAKVNIGSILIVMPTQKFDQAVMTSATDLDHPLDFHILPALAASVSDPHSPALTAVLLSLPDIKLESAKSHVLDEPVQREGKRDTLPWDCTLSQLSLFTVANCKALYVIEPTVVKATLAAQQEGVGITAHTETIALAVSQKQISLLSNVVCTIKDNLLALYPSTDDSEEQENGKSKLQIPQTPIHAPSHHSSPTYSTVTPSTLPVSSESTATSLVVYPGLSSLWIQVLVSKLAFHIYLKEPKEAWSKREVSSSVNSSYATPMTSPTSVSDADGISVSSQGNVITKLSLEIDSASLQVDIQEKCMNIVFKVAIAEGSYLKWEQGVWMPCLSSEKLFSSRRSAIPDDLSQVVADFVPAITVQIPTSPFHQSPTKQHRNFIFLDVKIPFDQPHKSPKIHLSMLPFEVVAWLPLAHYLHSLVAAATQEKPADTVKSQSKAGLTTDVASWPAVEISLECFRVVLPTQDYSSTLLLSVGGLQATSSVHYASPDVRYMVNSSLYRRLSLLSSEKKQPPLPVYQLDAYSISLWGLTRKNVNGSPKAHLYASSANLRVVYTPPLYWIPHPGNVTTPLYKSESPSLACGHCVEANLTTDLNLVLGIEQIGCVSDILASNILTSSIATSNILTQKEDKPLDSKILVQSTESSTPFKLLLTGGVIAISMLTDSDATCGDFTINQSDLSFDSIVQTDGIITPLLQASIYNPLCSIQSNDSTIKCEISCFNAAVCYSDTATSVSYADLMDGQTVPSLLGNQFLETQNGQPQGKSDLPSSFLTLNWSSVHKNGHPDAVVALSLDIGRPTKLTFTPALIQEALKVLQSMSKVNKLDSDKSRDERESDPKDSDTSQQTVSQNRRTTSNLEVKFTTTQVLVELQLPVPEKANLLEIDASLQTEGSAPSITTEGFLLVWDNLTVAYPHQEISQGSTRLRGDLHVSGLQLLVVADGHSSPVILPMQLNCLFSQHLPSSTLDLPQVEVSFSCGLLQFNVSQTTITLAMKTIKVISDIATSLNGESSAEEPTRNTTGPDVEATVVQFTDDLRTGEFKYITENMDRPRTPDLGEIVFHLGNQDTVATMAWHYQEPRAITNLKILPVPFSITTEDDVPVDIKVVCGLEYWSDELNSYVSLLSFHVSEGAVTEVLLPPEQQVPSRRWRMCVNDVEWVDEEEGELLISKANVSDDSGSQVPLSSILSPLSLAASTQIDSYFSSSFIPLYTVNAHFQDIQATLLHSTNTKCTSGCYFRGYRIIHNSYDTTPQELLRMDISSFTGHLRQTRNSSTSLKLDGLVSLHFVDFRDLTWRTTIHPTNLNAKIETQKTKEATHWSARSDTNSSSELTVAVKCSPTVVRVSQGLVHTTTLAAHAWSSSVDDNTTSKETASFTIFNQFILCNDTLEDLHIGQVSTDENLMLPSNTCIGYSWRSHKTSPPQALHACLVTDGVWRWTKPFDISTTGVQEIQLFVGINTATLYVHVTDLGGLQKQVTLCGSWKLCTSLPFALEAQLVFTHHNDEPWMQKQEVHKDQPHQLSLTPGTAVPSIIAADNELAGVQVRISGVKDGWSIVYPLNSTAHDWNKPQLLAEVSTNSSETIHCWYNIRPVDSTDGQPWGNKITFAPLFAVCNYFPFELILNIVSTNADGHSSSLPSCVVPSRGMNLPLTNLSADTWYHLKFRISESTAISEPAVALSTYLLLQLPFSPHKSTDKEWPYDTPAEKTQDPPPDANVATAACKLTLPLEGGCYCSVNATILRSTLNTVTVYLKPETLVVNRCPLTIRLVEAMTEEDEEESRMRITDLAPMDVGILVHKEFTLCLPWKDQQLLSEPVMLPTKKEEKSKDGKDKDHPTPLKVVLCNDKSSTNQIIGELLITFNWYDDMLVAAVKPNYIVYNNTSHQLSLWPCVMMNQPQSELLYVTATCLKEIAPGESKEVVFWHGEGVPSDGTTRALSLKESGKEAEETEWSIFISPNYVRYSFALPTSNSQEPFLPCVITTHEHESVTYIVIAHDPSPRLQIQNLCGAMVEVVASETNGIDAFPQPIPPGHQVAYEVPTLAKLYPAVYDEDIATDFEKQLQKASQQVSLSFRACCTCGEDENEGTWSSPFPLTSDKDKVIDIPGMGSILVSTHRQGNTQSISLLPTGMVSSFQPVGKGATTLLGERKVLTFDGTITEFVFCLDDEASDPLMINEVLRIIGNDAELHYSSSAEDGTIINLAIRSLHVDNMSESSLGEFSVTMIPRAEHIVAAELIKSEPLPLVRLTVHYNPHTANLIDTFNASCQPVTLQLEDSLLLKCKSLLHSYGLPGVLKTESFTCGTTKLLVVPPSVLQEAERDASPLIISSLVIEPTSFFLNAKISLKVLLSCNDSSFRFSRYELRNVYSNFSEVSQTISAHYISMIIMQIGWLLGSLELIGSPGTFIQSVGRGLRDLVKLPYEGLTRSPSLFIVGIGQGTASFFRQFSSGALGSVTNLASSISRNMERLSMDPDHVSFQERKRRERPATHFTSGLVTGISSFSLSLMSAVAGIVEQPMQSVHQMEASPTAFGATKSLLAGMGKGLIGAVAKPVGGAMELVSQTGQGLLHGTGLTQKLIHKAIELDCYTGPIHRSNLPTTTTRCAGKLEATECLLAAVPVIHVSSNGAKNSAILLLTHTRIHLLDCESDSLQQNFSIGEYNLVEKGSPQVDEVELHLLQPSQSHPQKESPKFQPIEHYLQLSQPSSHELVISPQFETLESLPEEPAEDSSMILLVKTHKAAQLLCVYRAVRQCLVEPKSTFCIHASSNTQCHDSLLQKDSFYSCT